MKKGYVFICLFFIYFSSSILLFAQKPNISGSYKIYKIHKDFQKSTWFSYDVEKAIYTRNDSIYIYNYSVINNNKNHLYAQIGLHNKDVIVDDENIKIINRNKDEIACYSKYHGDTNANMYSNLKNSYLVFENHENIYSPYWRFDEKNYVYGKNDTIIDGVNYTIFKYKSAIYYFWDYGYTMEEAEKNNKISQYMYDISYFYNKRSKYIDRIEQNTIDLKGGKSYTTNEKVIYKYSNISKEDKQYVLDSVFNFKRKEYLAYKISNDETSLNSISKNDTSITDELLTYPLVNIYGDTTNIENINGWIFLDFWFYGCSVCYENFENLVKEKQDYGQTILEKNGIKILCINPYARDISKLKNNATECGMDDYFYSALDIEKQIKLNVYPLGFLVSPDKQIVYKHAGLLDNKDYDKIFEIIKNYKQ